jgi:hypothetical protein
MRILAIYSGEYGIRHINNIRAHGPATWNIDIWKSPTFFPPVIDYPEDYLPAAFPPAELILSFGEHRGIAELLPDIAKMTGANAVIAPVDSEAWLPRGLVGQLRGWLERMGVALAAPKPLCTLTERDYAATRRQRISYDSPLISEFARYFGQPELDITVDPQTRQIQSAAVRRDAVCGCLRYVAGELPGISADDAEEKTGMLHHHYPCLAAMGIDVDFGDTLMHVSGNIFKDKVGEQIRPFRKIQYIAPGNRSE